MAYKILGDIIINDSRDVLDARLVGIGTNSPQVPLEIAFTSGIPAAALISSDAAIITAEDTAPGFSIVSSNDISASGRGVFKAVRSRGTLASPTAALNGDQTFSLLGAIYDGAAVRATAAIDMSADSVVSSAIAPQRISFSTGETTSITERMRITSSGNVGIGTTNPRSQVHIYGAGQTTANLTDSGDMGGILRVSTNGSAAGNGGGIIFASLQSDDTQTAGMAAIKSLLTNGNINT